MKKIKDCESYLKNKGYNIKGLSKEEVKSLCEKVYKDIQIKGTEKRLRNMENSNKVKKKEILRGNCNYCGKAYNFEVRSKMYNYMKDGYCNFECYKLSGENARNYKLKVLQKAGIEVKNLEEDFRIFFGTKASEWMKSFSEKKKKEDAGYFSKISIKGSKTRKKKFLIENNIIDSCGNVSEERINDLFKKHFNEISKHGEKVSKGLKLKYQDVSDEFRRRYNLGFENFLEKSVDDYDNIDKKQKAMWKTKWNKQHVMKGSTLEWKKTHLRNLKIENVDQMSDNEINLKYSEYLSERFKGLTDSLHNGYTTTKKGWYKFKNIDKQLFFRSSWEEKVYEAIDSLILTGDIIDVGVPDRIEYFMDYKRHYYPDIKYTLKDGREIVCEVKPLSKLDKDVNRLKIEEAHKRYDCFIVLTEKEIFGNNLHENILKGEGYSGSK